MLDINLLRKDLDGVVARLATRKSPQPFLDVERFRALEAERKTIQTRTEELQARRNSLSKQIGQLKGKGEDTAVPMAEVAGIGDELKASAERLEAIQSELNAILMALPNLPQPGVPVGPDETANVEVRRWGTPKELGFGWMLGKAGSALGENRPFVGRRANDTEEVRPVTSAQRHMR